MKRGLYLLLVAILLLGGMPRSVFAQPADEKPLDIVWVTAETKPFASTGGLGNVSQELPATFNELGHKTTVIMPLYHMIDPVAKGLVDTGIEFKVGSENVKLWKGTTNGVEVYFLDNKRFFSGPRDGGIYVDKNEKDYKDNPGRWDFLSRASLEAMKKLGLKPDVIHANDHHTGALPYYANKDSYFERTLKVFEIHNAAYQGQVDLADIDQTELRRSGAFDGAGSPAEAWGKANPLKLGIRSSDVVLTVSPNYAKETMEWRFGAGMEGDLRERYAAGRYIGILNGTDATWNPAKDPFIWQKYSRNTLDKKAVNKAELQKFYFGEAGVNAETPFMGTVSRFTDQKGIDRIIHAVTALAEKGERFQYVILGTADTKYAPQLEALARRFPDRVKVDTDFTVAKEHRMYAGLDGFLMPSNWEPSGLPQMYSERYGTIPIVSDVGGLVDSVKDYDPATGKGTGIIFRAEMGNTWWGMAKVEFDRILGQFDKDRLDSTTEGLKRAIDLFRSKDHWRRMQSNAMRAENRWTKVAGPAYIRTFREMLEGLRGWSRDALGSTIGATDDAKPSPEAREAARTPGFSRALDRGFDRTSTSDGLQSEAVRERIRQSRDRVRAR
ncbi:MAG: glycogen synthase [Planctomycetota bacterium]